MVVPTLSYSFFATVAEGIAQRLRQQGYQLLMSSTRGDVGEETAQVRAFLSHRVDALIIAPSGPIEKASEFDYLREQRVPFVLVGRGVPPFPVNFVGNDGLGIGRMAAEHLIAQGCRRIAHIAGPPVAGSRQRERGHREALERNGLKPDSRLIVSGGDSIAGGYEAARQLLQAPRRPDGIGCYNDIVAAGAMRALLDAGVRIPEEIAITGVGNLTFSDVFQVPLTTIEQSPFEMGVSAAQLALDLVTAPDAKPARVLVPARLIERESSQRNAPGRMRTG
jgi:LacI family transcriptional regulator